MAIARLILVPVIFLAVYYLFEMEWIVDRIVNLDAPAAKLAQGASIEILEARRAERNYLLLHDLWSTPRQEHPQDTVRPSTTLP